jgi:hypothetical protein
MFILSKKNLKNKTECNVKTNPHNNHENELYPIIAIIG